MLESSWSLRPAGLELVLARVAAGCERIVECGSGESTAAIAKLLARRGGGRLYSLEHDGHWRDETAQLLREAGAGERVALLHAPLRDGWYDRRVVAGIPAGVDLLLVDGPPGALRADGETRYPALPELAAKLAPGATVILDDIHRPGERRVLERWCHELPVEFALHPEERLAIGVFCERQGPAEAGER